MIFEPCFFTCRNDQNTICVYVFAIKKWKKGGRKKYQIYINEYIENIVFVKHQSIAKGKLFLSFHIFFLFICFCFNFVKNRQFNGCFVWVCPWIEYIWKKCIKYQYVSNTSNCIEFFSSNIQQKEAKQRAREREKKVFLVYWNVNRIITIYKTIEKGNQQHNHWPINSFYKVQFSVCSAEKKNKIINNIFFGERIQLQKRTHTQRERDAYAQTKVSHTHLYAHAHISPRVYEGVCACVCENVKAKEKNNI